MPPTNTHEKVCAKVRTIQPIYCGLVHGMLPRFPFLAEAPHRLSKPHRQRGNRFEALFSAGREFPVIFSVYLRKQEFRVAQDSRQRIVQLVAQHFSKIFILFFEGLARAGSKRLHRMQTPFDQVDGRPQAATILLYILGIARFAQRGQFREAAR
jgi:hypothetical protein